MKKIREVKEVALSNETFDLEGLHKLYPEFECVQSGMYFPYNYIYDDDRWGCAWRAIQLMLSAHGVKDCDDFKKLFQQYVSKEKLISVINSSKMPIPLSEEKLKESKWAPDQNQYNWAEPFIGQIICAKYKLPTQLLLVNGYPAAYAPQQFFQKTIGFEEFWKLVKETIPFSPIMIDDSLIALSIVGYWEESDKKRHLIMGDPHINSNRDFKTVGIYKVTLDQNGNQLSHEFPEQKSKQCHRQTYNRMDFATKKWMIMRVVQQN